MALNDLRVNLTLDNSGFRLSIADSTRVLRQFEQRLGNTAAATRRAEGAFSSFGIRAQRMIQTIGLARFALMDLNTILLAFPRAVLTSAGEIERMTKLMEGLSRESTAAARQMEAAANVKFVFNLAKNAPFEVKALTDTVVKFKSAGLDPANGSMQALVDSVARFGGSSEQLHRASIAIQQMAGKGVISMEELRQQLGEAVPTAMAAMAAGMRMSMAELAGAIKKGTVESQSALKKMFAIMAVDNAAAASAMMTTWTGMLERLKTSWETWKLTVAGQGMAEGAKSGLQELIDLLNSPAGASFARSVGRSMSEATTAVISFAKGFRDSWEEIKTAGQLILFYFGASKIAPLLAASAASFKAYYARVIEGAARVRAQSAMDVTARRAAMLDNAAMVESTIAKNNAIIASEQAAANAKRAIKAQELAAVIAANRAELASNAQKQAANRAAILAADPRNSAAVRAVANRTATAAQDLQAQRLLRTADAARVSATEIQKSTDRLKAHNEQLRNHRNGLLNNAAALTNESQRRAAANAGLLTSAERYRRLAAAVTASNSAMLMMQKAGSTVIGAVRGLLFSMNGLIIVIMAAAWAWNYFSDKAKKAANDAKIAIDAAKRQKEGNVNDDTVKSMQDNINNDKDKAHNMKRWIGTTENQAVVTDKDKEKLKKWRRDLAIIENNILVNEQNLANEKLINARTKGADSGRAIAEKFTQGVADGLSMAKGSVESIEAYYAQQIAKNGKLTKKEETDRKNQLVDARRSALVAGVQKYVGEISKYGQEQKQALAMLASAGNDTEKRLAAETMIAETNAKIMNARQQSNNMAGQIADLDSEVKILDTKGPKGPKKSKRPVLDGVEKEILNQKEALVKADGGFQSLMSDAIDVNALKAQYMKEVANIREEDEERGIKARTGSNEDAMLVDLKVKNAVMDRIQKLYGDMGKQREQIEEQYIAAMEQVRTGSYTPAKKSDALKLVEALEDELSVAEERLVKIPGEVDRFTKLLAEAKKMLAKSGDVDAAEAFGENKKQLDQLEPAGFSDSRKDRQRMQSRQEMEMKQLLASNAAQLKNQAMSLDMREQLIAQHYDLVQAMTDKHVQEMKSPLERLGDSWKDVTGNMEQATEKWAADTMDTFVDAVSGGKAGFRDLAASILKDILRIQMQSTIGNSVTGLTKKAGNWASETLASMMPGAGGGKGGEGSKGGFLDSTMSMLNKGFQKLIGGSETAAGAVGDKLADSAGQAAGSLVESVIMGATKMTAEQTAMGAMVSLTIATEAAAAAMWNAAAASAGNAVTDLFANGGIMSSSGSLPLKMYSNGGIADRPQMAIFGEGSMNEAYVPLPDGRSIPVTVKGMTGGGGNNVTIGITIMEGTEKKSSDGDNAGMWNKMAERVKIVVQQELSNESRPGGMFYNK